MEYAVIIDNHNRIVGQGKDGLEAFRHALGRHEALRDYGSTFYEIGELPDGWKYCKMSGRRVRNFTPHDLAIYGPGGDTTTWESEGSVRAIEEDSPKGSATIHEGLAVDLVWREYVGTEGVPALSISSREAEALRDGDMLIVSLVAAQALKKTGALEALDAFGVSVFMPDTGPGGVVRDDEGRILGTKRLVMV